MVELTTLTCSFEMKILSLRVDGKTPALPKSEIIQFLSTIFIVYPINKRQKYIH